VLTLQKNDQQLTYVLKTSPGASVQVCYGCTHTTTMGVKGLNQERQK